MKNLKKVLCLVLVFAMAFGLMISANAATFSDQNNIKNTDAVALLDSLNIMAGHADGSFEPDGVLTRAQVAKMVYVARTGGVDDQAVLYKNGNNTFSDTKGHWAEGYINYAAAKGFVAGRGNGKFDPDASITGYELMKIALCALGYDSEVEGFVGASWKSNTAALAQEAGLTTGYTADPAAPITRDNAACVFANLIYATTIRYSDGVAYKYVVANTNTGVDNPYTFGEVYLNLIETTGVMIANDKVGIDSGAALGKGMIGVYTDSNNDGTNDKEVTFNAGKFDINVPENYIGQTVTVMYRKNSSNTVTNIYGVDAKASVNKVTEISFANSATFNASNTDGAKVYNNYSEIDTNSYYNKFDSKAAKLGFNYKNATDMSQFNAFFVLASLSAVPTRCVDNNGDGVYDYIFQTTLELAKVTSAAGGSVVLNPYNTKAAAVPTLTSTNAVGIDGLAKKDIVVYRLYGDTYYVDKCQSVEATVNAFTKDDVNKVYDVTLDGVKYSAAVGVNGTYGNGIFYETPVGEKNVYYTYGGKLVYMTAADAVIPNYALVKKAQEDLGGSYKVAVMLDTGVSGTYTVSSYNSKTTTTELGKLDDNTDYIVQYSLNDDGTISLKDPINNYVKTDTLDNDYKQSQSNLVDNYYVSSSTVAFVTDAEGNYYRYVGIGNIPAITKGINIAYVGGKAISGSMYYTNCVFFKAATFAGTVSKDYYLVTSTPATIDSTGNLQFTAYLGGEAVTLKANPDMLGKILKTEIYTFEFNEKGYVKAAKTVNTKYTEGYAIDGTTGNVLVLSTIDKVGTDKEGKPNKTYDNTMSVNFYSVDSGTLYYYYDTTAGTVTASDKEQLADVVCDNDEIIADVNDTYVDWNFGKSQPKTQIKVINNDSDDAMDVVFIFSTPQDYVNK